CARAAAAPCAEVGVDGVVYCSLAKTPHGHRRGLRRWRGRRLGAKRYRTTGGFGKSLLLQLILPGNRFFREALLVSLRRDGFEFALGIGRDRIRTGAIVQLFAL